MVKITYVDSSPKNFIDCKEKPLSINTFNVKQYFLLPPTLMLEKEFTMSSLTQLLPGWREMTPAQWLGVTMPKAKMEVLGRGP